MSGHSKWSTIKRKKGIADQARAKVFTKIGKEISVAVKAGGGDPTSNARLRDLIAKAKAANMPNDNIDRVIKKAAGGADKTDYQDVRYEGYGPNGIAVIVEGLTDNRNRTAGEIRHIFDKFGGNLGTTGCVSFMFEQKGVLTVLAEEIDEDKLMEDALEAGAADLTSEDGVVVIYTDPADFSNVLDALQGMGYSFESAQIEQVPNTYTTLTDPDSIVKMQRLLDSLDDNEDVTEVWHNWENSDEE
jgi:YebC/PmpR family DNA-binding regulatory protein